ncbi:MAG: hypothetical protein AAGI09_15225 [Pseudomonadota bacterium]
MFRISKSALTLAATAALAFMTPMDASAANLTAEEFKSIHTGKCFDYSGPTKGQQCFNADGTTTYTDESYGSDTGKWTMRSNQVCVNWSAEPGWDCGAIARVSADTYSDGEYTWTIK